MKRILGILGIAATVLLLIGSAFGIPIRGKHAVARTYWPEKEGVRFVPREQLVLTGTKSQVVAEQMWGHGMRDPCVPPSPFAPALLGSQPC